MSTSWKKARNGPLSAGRDRTGRWALKSKSRLLLLLMILFLAAAILKTAAAMGSNAINNETNSVFEAPWQYCINQGSFSALALPSGLDLQAGAQITLRNRLPSEMVKGATILLRTSQQDAAVAVNGAVIYRSREGDSGVAAPSSAYHFVRLPTDCAGQTITVMLSSPLENYAGLISQIYIGSKASHVFFLVHENGPELVIGFLIFTVGVLLIVMFVFTRGQKSSAHVIDLGAFFACAGYWVMVESRMMQFFIPYPVVLTNSSIFALTLLPVFSGLYYYNTHTSIYRRVGQCVMAVLTAASLLCAAASCVDLMLPVRVLPLYAVFLGLYLLVLFVSIIVEHLRAGKQFSASVCGMVVFGVCALLDLAFYLGNIKAYHPSCFLIAGLLLFSVFMVADSVQNFSRVYHAAIKVDALSALAYADSLTGLPNRTAFLQEMSTIEAGKVAAVTMAMYDVNSLKLVNDTMGHLVGDALLRHCAKVIQASLRQEDLVYRIGGDEFVAILRHSAALNTEKLGARLCAVVQRENQKTLNYTLSIAYGYATFSSDMDRTLFDTQARADKAMYARKKVQKAGLTTHAASEQ